MADVADWKKNGALMQTICPTCQSAKTIRNGKIHTGKQHRLCKACGRQFVEEPQKHRIPQEKWDLVGKLLLEKLPIAGIIRVTGISESRMFVYLRKKYAQVPTEIQIKPKKKGT